MLKFGQVTGRFLASVADTSSDLDTTPDAVPLTGYVTFTPSIQALQTEVDGVPVTVVPSSMTYHLDSEGYLVHEGVRSISLIATDNLDDRPYNWTHKVDFAFSLNGRAVNHASFSISVPSEGTVDLAQVMPVTTSTGTVVQPSIDLSAYVQSVNGVTPDANGDVIVTVQGDGTAPDTGWRIMPNFTGTVADSTKPGTWLLRRHGQVVYCRLIGVGVEATSPGFLGPNALPVGFRLATNVGSMTEMASQHSTGVVSVIGPTHKVLFSDNDVTWKGIVSPSNNSLTTTTTGDHQSLIHGEISWTTEDEWPTTMPGVAA